jgi:hypothetical protein
MRKSCQLQFDSVFGLSALEKKVRPADAKRNTGCAPFEICLRMLFNCSSLTSAKQFLIEIEANLRFLRKSALVTALRTRLNF